MDNRRPSDVSRVLLIRTLAVGVVLYWLGDIVLGYVQGGPGAPSLTLLILSILVLGGGSVLIGIDAWRMWKKSKENDEEM